MKLSKYGAFAPNPPLTIATSALVLLLVAGTMTSEHFATLRNLSNVLEQSAPLGALALGQMLVVLAGGIDLSIGAIVTASAVTVAALCDLHPELTPVILVGAVVGGALLGAANGVLINRTGVHPLIVTLGTSSVLNGVVLLYTMRPVGGVPIWLEDFAYGATFGVPNAAIVVLTTFGIAGLLLNRSATGQAIYAVGGNAVAAAAVGLSVRRITLLVYTASGLLAALAGIYFACRTGTGDPRVGDTLTLASITPVVVGGTALGGGVGTLMGTLVGVTLVSVLGNVLNYMNVSSFFQWIAQGVIILAAVSLSVDRNRKL